MNTKTVTSIFAAMCLGYEYYQRETINKSLLEKVFKIIEHKETIVTAKQLETTTRPIDPND